MATTHAATGPAKPQAAGVAPPLPTPQAFEKHLHKQNKAITPPEPHPQGHQDSAAHPAPQAAPLARPQVPATPPPPHKQDKGILGNLADGVLNSDAGRAMVEVGHDLQGAGDTIQKDVTQAGQTVQDAAAAARQKVEGVANTIRDAILSTPHQLDVQIEAIKHPLDPSQQINQLHHDGDVATFSVNVGGKVQVPLWSPVPWGPQAQYGFDAKVKRAPGHNPGDAPGYDVTFGKNLQAGIGAEAEVKDGSLGGTGGIKTGYKVNGLRLGAELNIGTADQVTMHFATKEDAIRGVKLMEQVAVSQAVRDSEQVLAPSIDTADPAAHMRNPLAGTKPLGEEGDGFKVPLNPATAAVADVVVKPVVDYVASRVQPSAAETAFLRQHISSYTTQVTASGRVGMEAKLGDILALQGRAQLAGRMSRTVTVPQDGKPGTVSYTVAGDLTLDGRERSAFKGKVAQLGGAEAKAGMNNVFDVGKLTGEVTVTYNLNEAQTTAARRSGGTDLPGLGDLGRRITSPDRVQMKLQATGPVQNPLLPHRTDQGQVTLSADLVHPKQDLGALVNGMMAGNTDAALQQLDNDGRIKLETTRIDRTGFNLNPEFGLKVEGKFNAGVSAQVQVGVDNVVDSKVWVNAGHQPAYPPSVHPTRPPVRPHEPSRA